MLLFLLLIARASSDQCGELLHVYKTDNRQVEQQLKNIDISQCAIRIEPTYFWGQNMTHLHIKFRFSLTEDSAACSELYNFTKNVTHNGFSLSATCFISDQVVIYNLTVLTWKSINYNFCEWKSEEMSTKVVQCLKSPFPYFWKTLHADENYRPKNMHYWWDIYRRYRDQIGDLIGLLEIEEQFQRGGYRSAKTVTKKQKSQKTTLNLHCQANSPFDLASWL